MENVNKQGIFQYDSKYKAIRQTKQQNSCEFLHKTFEDKNLFNFSLSFHPLLFILANREGKKIHIKHNFNLLTLKSFFWKALKGSSWFERLLIYQWFVGL